MSLVKTITIPEMKGLLRSLLLHPPKTGATGFCGGPGIGKTSIIEQVAQEVGIGLSVINAGLVGLGEISGVVFPEMDSQRSVLYPSKLLEPSRATFIDEFSNADLSIFKAFSNLLVNGVIPGHPAPYSQARLFAYNPAGVSDLAHNIPTIVRNRADIYEVQYDADDFIAYAFGRPEFHPVVIAFIMEFKDSMLQVKDFTPTKTHGAEIPDVCDGFPSPRAYEVLSDRLFRIETEEVTVPVLNTAQAILGPTGKAFADYYRMREYIPSIPKILKGDKVPFPEAAMQTLGSGKRKPYVQVVYMTCIYALNAAKEITEFRNFIQWIFSHMADGTLDKELLLTLTKLSELSIHSKYTLDTLVAAGKASLGAKEFKDFLQVLIKSKEAAEGV